VPRWSPRLTIHAAPTATFFIPICNGSTAAFAWPNNMSDSFLNDVHAGLSSTPKTLPSKYFYDAAGDALFIKIMSMPEYYLTDAETEIFARQSPTIIKALNFAPDEIFEVIELGAGDGSKTVRLLDSMLQLDLLIEYIPIDISPNALEILHQRIKRALPTLPIVPQAGDYFSMLKNLSNTHHPKLVLFLGSNIGNLYDDQASEFMAELGASLQPGDKLLLGVDLIKSADTVLPAYDDPQGFTRDFNLNLLRRINRELGGNFNLQNFSHHAEYTEEEGIARSFLVSEVAQTVELEAKQSYQFAAGERIKTEISRKYNRPIVESIVTRADFRIAAVFTDSGNLFADYLLEKI
jgi:dimethylhistidine N-methyltransferase